ncbi:MAG TPA: class I SAM-dependent methyltransferase [Bryobacteraceae bacterium]|nr:class I SAM-dependent methyltransferase [Bryobacteraceae bacterium]
MTGQQTVKQCCASLYESDFAKLLLGDSFHPGGLKLTERLGSLLELTPKSRVLDAASGKGTSALFLAERFGCEVLGVDYGNRNVEEANASAAAKGLSGRARFERADAERLPAASASFDAVICECAFCTFPDKAAAAREFARVLRPRGAVGLSDLTRSTAFPEKAPPEELEGLLAWISCIADAKPVASYIQFLSSAGLRIRQTEIHDEALAEMVHQVRGKLLGAEILVGLKKLDLPGVDFTAAKRMAQAALEAVREGKLGYAIVCGVKD